MGTKVSLVTYYWRSLVLLSHILLGVFCATFVLPLSSKHYKHSLIRWWSTRVLSILNVTVITSGVVPEPSGQGRMYIANHISWVDIFALMSVMSIRFIAKSEIRSWPVFGYLASSANVLFIDRSKRKEAKRMQSISVESLNNGEQLCFFPEGTTTDGTHILPFKGSIIQAAIDAKAVLQPVGIFYPNPDHSANIDMAFAGETTMVESMSTILRCKASIVTLHYFEPIDLQQHPEIDRGALTQQAYTAIKARLFPAQR